jgi:proteic killer suppression protein
MIFFRREMEALRLLAYTLDVTSNSCHNRLMPPKYRDKRTTKFAAGERVNEFESFRQQAEKRLEILDAAVRREDLMRLPSNRFEALHGNRQGQYSIRINAQRMSEKYK